MIDSIVVLASILVLVFLLRTVETRSDDVDESEKDSEKT
jgi:hypothetical protein